MKYLLETKAAQPGHWVNDSDCVVSQKAMEMMYDISMKNGKFGTVLMLESRIMAVATVESIMESIK